MVILDVEQDVTALGYSLCVIIAAALIIGIIALVIGNIDGGKTPYVIAALCGISILFSIFGLTYTDACYHKYKLYAEDIDIENLESEYEIINMEGLIIEARKKGEK